MAPAIDSRDGGGGVVGGRHPLEGSEAYFATGPVEQAIWPHKGDAEVVERLLAMPSGPPELWLFDHKCRALAGRDGFGTRRHLAAWAEELQIQL